MKFHVRVHWSKSEDWSSIEEAKTPGEALTLALERISRRVDSTTAELAKVAYFTVSPPPRTDS